MVEEVRGTRHRRRRARPRHRNRVRYAFGEFLLIPVLVVLAWTLLGIAAVLADRPGGWMGPSLRNTLAVVVPPSSSSMLLSTLTPGLLTVISIIFFVMLMAVQQVASTYTPVVLDQFLRRKFNQLFFGMFVGLTVYCLLVLGLVPPNRAVMSSLIALVLSVLTFGMLLVFVYSTVDQMRPSATMWRIQQLAMQARATQQPLLSRCRMHSRMPEAPTTRVVGEQVGYVVHISGTTLSEAIGRCESPVEVELLVSVGEHLVPGAVIAEVRGQRKTERERIGRVVLDAIVLGRMRDIDRDASHSVDHLASMAWAASSVSGDPEGARIAVETLHSMMAIFRNQDEHIADLAANRTEIPVVYSDRVVSKIIDSLNSVVAAAGPSGQHQTVSAAIMALARVLPDLDEEHQEIIVDRLQRTLPTLINQPYTIELAQALDSMHSALDAVGLPHSARRISQLAEELSDRQRLADPTQQ